MISDNHNDAKFYQFIRDWCKYLKKNSNSNKYNNYIGNWRMKKLQMYSSLPYISNSDTDEDFND